MRFLDEREMNRVFEQLPDHEARAETLAELDGHLAIDLIRKQEVVELVPIIAAMSPDDQADILSELSDGVTSDHRSNETG